MLSLNLHKMCLDFYCFCHLIICIYLQSADKTLDVCLSFISISITTSQNPYLGLLKLVNYWHRNIFDWIFSTKENKVKLSTSWYVCMYKIRLKTNFVFRPVGQCVSYNGSFCSTEIDSHPIHKIVSVTYQELDKTVEGMINDIIRSMNPIDDKCLTYAKKIFCNHVYPSCHQEEGEVKPVHMCR
jgi:hypothetical protein